MFGVSFGFGGKMANFWGNFVWLFIASVIQVSVTDAASRCEIISIPMCQHLGYNTTLMPNLMGHADQREALLGVSYYNLM